MTDATSSFQVSGVLDLQSQNYSAAESSQKRKNPTGRPKTTAELLPDSRRDSAQSNARSLDRNFSIASWAVRRHLDYVSSFSFQPRTGDKSLDAELERLMRWYDRPLNCDVAGRHSLRSMIRTSEAMRVIDGDVLLVKLFNGQLQAIEADRIRTPDDKKGEARIFNGVETTKAGRARRYAVHNRTVDKSSFIRRNGYEFGQWVRAGDSIHVAYFQRFDQYRGVSPLMSALDSFRDVSEGWTYALAKAKVSQLFGLVIKRDGDAGSGEFDHVETSSDNYDVKLGDRPFKLELDPGDEADFLESKTPPMELQTFTTTMVGAALKSLDLPFSFYDESFTNFFGSRSAFIHYKKACKSKILFLQHVLDLITLWRVRDWFARGTLPLPSGMTPGQIKWEWVPDGTPWWNPLQEISAAEKGIANKLTSPQRVIRETLGCSAEDILDEHVAWNDMLDERNLDTLVPTTYTPEPAEDTE